MKPPSALPENEHIATRFILIRHGETDWNREARMQGHIDIALNPLGQAQAAQVASALQAERLDAVYSSDLCRAQDTAAQICALQKHLVLQASSQLRERHYGIFQGRTLQEVAAEDPQAAERWRKRDASFAPAGGETLPAFASRIHTWLAQAASAHRGQQVCVVTHGGVLDVVWRLAHGLALDTPRAWDLPNTGINRLRFSAGAWQIDAWAEVGHLQDAAIVRDETIA